MKDITQQSDRPLLRLVDRPIWGRVTPQAEKPRSTLAEAKIAKAERAAKARMAQLHTLKTVPKPREGVLARAIRSIFG